jgi:hypothetical protein
VRACEGRASGSWCGAKRDVDTRLSVSNALCERGDLVGLLRRRIGERCPVTSARNTSFSFASSLGMFQPIGMPIAQEYRVKR